jgi:CHAD domain-containing protein
MSESQGARESAYVVADQLSSEAITQNLLALLPSRHQPIAKHRFTVLDTFDGRVRRASASLTKTTGNGGSTLKWQSRGGSDRLALRTKGDTNFAWDLPDGPLRQEVAPIIGPRRLLAQAEAEERGSMLEMVDDRGKTVARLRIACGQARLPEARGDWRPWPTMVTLTGLRGYEDVYERLVPVLASRPGIQPCPEGPVGAILRNVGAQEPRDLTSPTLTFDREVRADVGARQIHLALLDILAANEDGVRGNVDSEFLHDFRVAVRRARALLGQIRGVFRPDVVEHFAAEFSWIGRLSGPPRDTDVLILSLREQHREFDSDDMDALIAFLCRTQREEYARLISALDSDRYRKLLSDWKAFLESPAESSNQAAFANGPLAAAVARRARRLSKRIIQTAKGVDGRTPAEHIHQIRIDAKKLRYLVDITPAFYRPDDFRSILGALKKLQRALGDFNDAHVQETLLINCGRAVCTAGGPSGALVTLGRLAERSRQHREHLRSEVVEKLRRFRARDVRKACERAFMKSELPGPQA